ncbi:hypothetical protein [Paraflavitalea speifideaquila]|uniref:hypothetical protein n=1 Tax=Paraflavitalea speifideaquila TaxID=3076558 RepID=UPI0028E5E3D7|nr:hypothetical protein [Paraflavitalea speifideiaquila]
MESKELGLDNLVTAVFLHEFSHTRQQSGMGAMGDSIEKKHTFKDPELSDDIVQHVFQKTALMSEHSGPRWICSIRRHLRQIRKRP